MASSQSDAIQPAERRHTAGPWRVLGASLIGAAVLLLLCARELPAWADQKAPDIAPYAQWLDQKMDAAGLDAPYDAIHALMQRLAGTSNSGP